MPALVCFFVAMVILYSIIKVFNKTKTLDVIAIVKLSVETIAKIFERLWHACGSFISALFGAEEE